jgi:hypothetical protein
MASRMRLRVSSATGPLPLRTRDTVATETPALRATDLIDELIGSRLRNTWSADQEQPARRLA